MTKPIVTRLDTDIIERLDNLAKMTGRTKSYYIKEAINEKLEDMEYLYIAVKRSEDIKAGRRKTISWEDVKHNNGL